MLGLFVLVHREWGRQTLGRPGKHVNDCRTEFIYTLANSTGFLYHLFEHFVEMLDRMFTFKRIKALKCFFWFFFEGIRLDLVLNWIFICKPRIVKQHSSWHLFLFLSNCCLWQKNMLHILSQWNINIKRETSLPSTLDWFDCFIWLASVEWELHHLINASINKKVRVLIYFLKYY